MVGTTSYARPAPSSAPKGFGGLPLAPLWLGIGLFASYMLLWLALHHLTGILDGFRLTYELPAQSGQRGQLVWASPFGWFSAVNGLLIAYLFAAVLQVKRGAERDLLNLRPVLRWPADEFLERSQGIVRLRRAHRIRIAAAGTGAGFAIAWFDPGIRHSKGPPALSDPELILTGVRLALVAIAFALLTVRDFKIARHFFELGKNDVAVDLSNLRLLAPFATRGVRSVLIWMLALSIFSLFFLAPVKAASNGFTVVYGIAFAAVAFFLSVLGVRDSVIAAKEQELGRLSQAIARERDRLLPEGDPAPGTAVQDTRMLNLIAYRDMIEAVREWPFGASTWARVLIFMTLGVGSWVGGALVERILSTALE